jgi:hypothetical protein
MRTQSPSPLLLIGSAVLALMGRPAPARAISRFPGEIIDYFKNVHSPPKDLKYTPPCSVCHIGGTTGSGSVQTPFGISMLAHGLTGDRNSITPALVALDADAVDSDGDGVSDIDELIADTDPNAAANVSLSSSNPSYGCSVAPGRGGQIPCSALGAAILAALVFLRRPRLFSGLRSRRG